MDRIKFPWININGYMQDYFRPVVVGVALDQYRIAPKSLRQLAKTNLFGNLKVPGFRRDKIEQIPNAALLPHMVDKMQRTPAGAHPLIL